MNAVQPFDFNGTNVRIQVDEHGEPWFVLADLCTVLGIARAAVVATRLADDEKGVCLADTPGGRQQMTTVNEAGMWLVILRSDSPAAEPVRRWVTHDVLPAIRRTGSYSATPALTDEQIVHQALQITYRKVQELEAKVAEDAPKVEYVDRFVADEDAMKLRTVASRLGIAEERLRSLLLDHGWIYVETASRWSASKGAKETVRRYSAYAHKRSHFLPVLVHEAPRFKGEPMHTLKVTPAGARAIAAALPRWLAGETTTPSAVGSAA